MRRLIAYSILWLLPFISGATDTPNIILVMSDDQGWGQTGYMGHPELKTPNLNAMAENGLRFNRFYASAPVCSPTRASVLTGRAAGRTGVKSHGYALRREERTIAQALQEAGYATGHFGKWHLDALRGPGVPVLADDPHSPTVFGFDEWLTVTNFFDLNPILGRKGEFEEFKGDSSEVIVDEAIKFIRAQAEAKTPSFTVIWYGSPHDPFYALEEDIAAFSHLKSEAAQKHHAEIRAMDRSIGTLRKALRDIGIEQETIVWFCSDNGGLAKKKIGGIDSVGGLRGNKASVWEGGLRVPGIIEWPGTIAPRITEFPASTVDIAPTLLDLLGIDMGTMLPVMDGASIQEIFDQEVSKRKTAVKMHFYDKKAVLIRNQFKLIQQDITQPKYELYDLSKDPTESNNVFDQNPANMAKRLKAKMEWFVKSVSESAAGKDYPNGIVEPRTKRGVWRDSGHYDDVIPELKERPEYQSYLKNH